MSIFCRSMERGVVRECSHRRRARCWRRAACGQSGRCRNHALSALRLQPCVAATLASAADHRAWGADLATAAPRPAAALSALASLVGCRVASACPVVPRASATERSSSHASAASGCLLLRQQFRPSCTSIEFLSDFQKLTCDARRVRRFRYLAECRRPLSQSLPFQFHWITAHD